MVKNCTTWQKILIRLSAVALATMAGFASLTAFAPTGARAVSEFDDKFQIGSMIATKNISPWDVHVDMYGWYQLIIQNTTNGSCANLKTFWLDNYDHPDYVEYIHRQEINDPGSNRFGLVWFFGRKDITGDSSPGRAPSSLSMFKTGTSPNFTYSLRNTTGQVNFNYSVTIQVGTSSSNGAVHLGDGLYSSISCNQLGQWVVTPGTLGYMVVNDWHKDKPVMMRGLTIDYPVGYEGPLVPENPIPNIPPKLDVPDVKMRGFGNWRGQFSDNNFSRTHEPPFTCEGGLAPVLHGELWDVESTPVLMDTYTASSTAIFTLDLPKTGVDTDYKLISWYECDDEVNVFISNQHYEFTITPAGGLKTVELHETCMSADFPFIHFEECMTTIFTAVEVMFFGNVQFGNMPVTPEGCYTLSVAGDWLGLSNKEVCPSYSSTVRNVTTPIVLFLLGLAFVRIINRRDVVDG